MKPSEYLDTLLESKLVATPAVESNLKYFTGIPDALLDIVRDLDIKYGIRVDKVFEVAGEMVHKLGFIKTIAGSPKANYEDLNIVKDANIKDFAEFVHHSPIYFNSIKSPSISEIEHIIRKHLPGKNKKQQTDLFDEAKQKETILYHTTLAKNVSIILKQGIVPKKKGITRGQLGQEIRAAVAVYAFTDRLDALQWAFRVEWDTKEKSAVIPFRAALKDWTADTHWEAGLGRGRWMYNQSIVPPEAILKDKIEYPDKETWHWLRA
jgi:hypothetical protein